MTVLQGLLPMTSTKLGGAVGSLDRQTLAPGLHNPHALLLGALVLLQWSCHWGEAVLLCIRPECGGVARGRGACVLGVMVLILMSSSTFTSPPAPAL